MQTKSVLVLSDLRSVYNVGSLFRTASTLPISHIYLCGTTPTPIDRFGRERSDLAKVSLGAERMIPWTYYKTTKECITSLKEEGFKIIAIEQSQNSVDYRTITLKEKDAFILGEETQGLPEEILSLVDIITEIPLKEEGKESLNVSVAGAVALFRILELPQ